MQTTRHETVFVTVSLASLNDPGSNRLVKVGETLQVTGEEWEMNKETHLTARQLK